MRARSPILPRQLSSLVLAALAVAGCGKARPVARTQRPLCVRCHGAPPDTGAHRAHCSPASAADVGYGDLHALEDVATAGERYDYGCGSCHPVDASRHMDGAVEVDLSPAGIPPGRLKALNAADAAWDGAARTCRGVYCHSSGQASGTGAGGTALPAFVATPAWSTEAHPAWGEGEHLACDACHGNPPAYPSGGPGAPDANGHLGLAFDGWEYGHFGGLPGPWHGGGSKHGGGWWGAPEDASAITCQTCHADTVDPAHTGPSGFAYLDTSGSYDLGGALGYACASCHAAGDPAAPLQGGATRPLRHVNGKREVVFDPRTQLPGSIGWLPAAPFTPSRPIWVTDASPDRLGADAVLEPQPIPAPPPGTSWPFTAPTLSLHLASARYDPATKSCSGVACHLDGPGQWGDAPGDYTESCRRCHAY